MCCNYDHYYFAQILNLSSSKPGPFPCSKLSFRVAGAHLRSHSMTRRRMASRRRHLAQSHLTGTKGHAVTATSDTRHVTTDLDNRNITSDSDTCVATLAPDYDHRFGIFLAYTHTHTYTHTRTNAYTNTCALTPGALSPAQSHPTRIPTLLLLERTPMNSYIYIYIYIS